MKNLLRTTTLLSVLLVSGFAQAASMVAPAVQFKFLSKDGLPVQGVGLSGILRFKVLTTKDCSGFICMPSLPHYKNSSDSGRVVGETDVNGEVNLAPTKWSTSKLSAKELAVGIFSNGLLWDLCNDDGEHANGEDIIDLKPVYNDDCRNVSLAEGDDRPFEMECRSAYTSKEIENMRSKVLASCKK